MQSGGLIMCKEERIIFPSSHTGHETPKWYGLDLYSDTCSCSCVTLLFLSPFIWTSLYLLIGHLTDHLLRHLLCHLLLHLLLHLLCYFMWCNNTHKDGIEWRGADLLHLFDWEQSSRHWHLCVWGKRQIIIWDLSEIHDDDHGVSDEKILI